MFYVSKESDAGGGLRFLCLMLAASVSIIPFTTPHEATAADTDTCAEGCTAYTWNGDSVVPLKAKSGETPKFTALGVIYTSDTGVRRIPTLKDSSGSLWTIEGTDFNLVKDSTLTFGTSSKNGSEGLTSNTPLLSAPLAGHGGRGYTNPVLSSRIGSIDEDPSKNINQEASQESDGRSLLSVDSTGRLWISSLGGTATSYPAPTVTQDSDNIEFTDIAQFSINRVYDGMRVILLGKPRTQAPTTVINQMPTTGAPTGLSNVGLLAVGVGLAGVIAVLIRRRRMA